MIKTHSRRGAIRRAAAVGAAAALFTLAACGSDDSGSTSSSTDGNDVKGNTSAPGYADLPESYRGKTIKIALDPGFGGLNSVDPKTKKFDGLNSDLAKAIAKELGASITLVPASFSGIVVGVEGGRYDMSMSAVTDTTERQATVDFVDYVKVSQVLIVPQGNPDKVDSKLTSACGLKLSVVPATTDEALFSEITKGCAEAGEDAPKMVKVDSVDAAYLAIESGRIDAMIRENSSSREGATGEMIDLDYGTSYYFGAIFAKKSAELRDAWLAGLKRIIESGEYAEILKENDKPAIALDKPGINLQK